MDWFTPSRRAISASRTPSARHVPRLLPRRLAGLPGPAWLADQRPPSLPAAPAGAASPHNSASAPSPRRPPVPPYPSCRSAATAMFRIAVSSSGYRNSCRDPAKITVWPPLSRRCRSRASGMPSKMAAAAADIHQPYHYLTYYAKSCIPSPQVTGTPAGDLGRRPASSWPDAGHHQSPPSRYLPACTTTIRTYDS